MKIDGNTSDGYHTFNELYEFRMLYNAALFNEWAKQDKYEVHKSWRHNSGEWCFGKKKKYFIVCAMTPFGLISNHYSAENWDIFKVPEYDVPLFQYDGHTSQDVANRLYKPICTNQ